MTTAEIIKIFLFLAICVTCISFFYYLRKSRVIEENLKAAFEALDDAALERAKSNRRKQLIQSAEPSKGVGKYVEKLYKLYTYSGLSRLFGNISFELYAIIVLVTVAVLYAAVFFITKKALIGILGACAYVVLLIVIEKLMALKNYKIVEKNLLNFLDMLGNFSAANVEIISVLRQVSRYMPEPLSTVVEECVFEAETMGNSSGALYAMAEKIEHSQFKEIVYDIESCINYAGNYKEIINKWKRMIEDIQLDKKDRSTMANELSLTMAICSVGVIILLCGIDELLVTFSIWNIVFNTVFGQVCAFLVAAIYLFFWYKIATIERG